MYLTKPWVGCFVYIFTGKKPNYDLLHSASVQNYILKLQKQMPNSKVKNEWCGQNHKMSNAYVDKFGRYIK